MKFRLESVRATPLRPVLGAGLACALLAFAALAQAGKVQPPPLPPGSAMVRVQGGMDANEEKRQERAHRHKGSFRRDFTRDDSQPGNGNGRGNGNGNGNGNGGKK